MNSAGGRAVPGDSIQDVDQGFLQVVPPPLANTLTARMHKGINTTCDEGQTLVPVAFGGQMSVPQVDFDLSQTLQAKNPQAVALAFSCKDYGGDVGDIAPTLRSMSHDGSHANGGGQVAVAFAIQAGAVRENPSSGPDGVGVQEGHAYTLEARSEVQAVAIGWRVRRIMPVEAERLQGFEDDYTRIPWRGKPAENCPDGPRYKAIGNSMAEPVMHWIGKRIDMVRAIGDGR